MTHVLVAHPSALVREAHQTLLHACGWNTRCAQSRSDALTQLAGPLRPRFGDLLLVDLSNWSVPGIALIQGLRRDLCASLPVLALLPPGDAADSAALGEAARRAGANLTLSTEASPQMLACAVSLLTGQPLPGLARLPGTTAAGEIGIDEVWDQQLALLALPDHAAASVVSARQVFELLLLRRQDGGSAAAALALTMLAGGPCPLQRWARQHHPAPLPPTAQVPVPPAPAPAPAAAAREVVQAMLLVEAGGSTYGLPLDSEGAPSSWWPDGPLHAPQPPEARDGVSLVSLLGSTGFRRLLATDRASVVLGRPVDGQATAVLRVDELLGLQHISVQPCSALLQRASGCTGLGRTGEGRMVLVLDADALARHLRAQGRHGAVSPR